jgi:hypothetical protein
MISDQTLGAFCVSSLLPCLRDTLTTILLIRSKEYLENAPVFTFLHFMVTHPLFCTKARGDINRSGLCGVCTMVGDVTLYY